MRFQAKDHLTNNDAKKMMQEGINKIIKLLLSQKQKYIQMGEELKGTSTHLSSNFPAHTSGFESDCRECIRDEAISDYQKKMEEE
jgi:hypothetical protein